MKLNINLDDALAYAIAQQRGWMPLIDDPEGELVGDEYPQIPNTLTAAQFLENLIPEFIQEAVLNYGQTLILTEFTSIFESINHAVKSGHFNNMILSGDLAGIKDAVKQSLP